MSLLVCGSNQNKKEKKSAKKSDTSSIKQKSSNQQPPPPSHQKYPYPKTPNPYKWTKTDVAKYLAHIGYPQYRENFVHQLIDGKALLCLETANFADIGVYAMGDVRKIEQEIKQLRNKTIKYAPQGRYDDWDYKSPFPAFDQKEYSTDFPDAYSKDKSIDKDTYFEIWSQLVQNRDCMLEAQYKRLMSRSGLAKDKIQIIWKLTTTANNGQCQFEQFSDIMKLAFLAQNRIPLYLINIQKLIFYHPTMLKFFKLNEMFANMQEKQVNENMVGFYGLPDEVLDSDTKLMDLEKLALRPFKPIHFEINAKVLIATFQQKISMRDIKALHESALITLRNNMKFSNLLLHDFRVQRPNFNDLGMTPGGPSDLMNIDTNVNHTHDQQHNGYQNGNSNSEENQFILENMQKLLKSDNFWEEFQHRSQIDKIIADDNTPIRTRQAMQMIAKLRGIHIKSVRFTDKGVKSISNKSKKQLIVKFQQCTRTTIAGILGIESTDIPEMYKGIVIEGLPDSITDDDEKIRQLDQCVLNDFIVSHIEVVDTVLRITFSTEVDKCDINQLRKSLKTFLKIDIGMSKQAMKKVSIIPHTINTWKGETTVQSVEPQKVPFYDMNSVPTAAYQ